MNFNQGSQITFIFPFLTLYIYTFLVDTHIPNERARLIANDNHLRLLETQSWHLNDQHI